MIEEVSEVQRCSKWRVTKRESLNFSRGECQCKRSKT